MDLLEFMMDTRWLVLFGCEKYSSIYNRIRYLISVKRGITYIISHKYAKVKDSEDSLPQKSRKNNKFSKCYNIY